MFAQDLTYACQKRSCPCTSSGSDRGDPWPEPQEQHHEELLVEVHDLLHADGIGGGADSLDIC